MFQIGQTIKALRIKNNLTQEAVARQLNVSAQAVSRWETGSSLPDISLLPAIAYFFNVSIDALFAYRPEDAASDVAAIQAAFYQVMDASPEEAEGLLREGLKKYPGNEFLLEHLLYLLRSEDRYEERIALCRRLLNAENETVRFHAKCVLAKSYRSKGHYALAKQLLEELPYFEYTALEMQATILEGEDSVQAAQREKTASLARLIEMLQVLAKHYARRGQPQAASATIQIAQAVLDAFQSDIPYRFSANDTPTQIYAAFEPERRRLSILAASYAT